MAAARVETRVSATGRRLSPQPSTALANPPSRSAARTLWKRAVTPSSLNRDAMVPYTGRVSGAARARPRLRASCLRTSRSASAAPLRSNLLMATTSAKSSMSIFSSWLAAPNSGVMTYRLASTRGARAASPCPMPEVSTMTRSNPASWTAASTSGSTSGISCPEERVASERM